MILVDGVHNGVHRIENYYTLFEIKRKEERPWLRGFGIENNLKKG